MTAARIFPAAMVLALLLPALAEAQPTGERKADTSYGAPRFRHVDQGAKPPKIDPARHLTLLADQDFPPFSYRDASGTAKGLAVDLALSLCTKLSVQCSVQLTDWGDLPAALERGTGDAVISGLKLDESSLSRFEPTRPLYRALGRFAVRIENPIAQPDLRLLAGKRVGVVAKSAHEAWLRRYFPQSQVIAYGDMAQAQAALRTAKVDALFGDALGLVYWTEGDLSQGCCRLVPGAFVDQDYFTRGFVFFVRRGDDDLKRELDYGLDELQETGEWDKIFHAYVPANPW